jgi:sugar O-acyltransferase (sialic acid O-acetyltransferase NeuD family)
VNPADASVVVAGTRTFAAEAIDFATEAGLTVVALLEPADRERVGGTIHERPVRWLDDGPAGDGDGVIVGTGDADRREVVARLAAAGFSPTALVHPRAHVAASATVGIGALIAPGVVVGARCSVGAHVVIGRGALVGHHTTLRDHVTLGPGANVAGNVVVGEGAFIAMGAVVRDHVTIGAEATVAMGAVVVSDVPAGAQVRGLPAR